MYVGILDWTPVYHHTTLIWTQEYNLVYSPGWNSARGETVPGVNLDLAAAAANLPFYANLTFLTFGPRYYLELKCCVLGMV